MARLNQYEFNELNIARQKWNSLIHQNLYNISVCPSLVMYHDTEM